MRSSCYPSVRFGAYHPFCHGHRQISPHEFVQEVSVSSKKRFHVGKQGESFEFLSWLLNELHRVRAYLFSVPFDPSAAL